MAETPNKTETTEAKTAAPTYKIADVRGNDVTVQMDDGRVFVARVKDNLTGDLKRGVKVAINSDGEDKSGAPKDAEVVRILS